MRSIGFSVSCLTLEQSELVHESLFIDVMVEELIVEGGQSELSELLRADLLLLSFAELAASILLNALEESVEALEVGAV